MAKKRPDLPSVTRMQSIIDLEVSARMDEVRAALKRAGIFVSSSMFVEIALRELFARRDLPEIMRRYKATARRNREP